MTTAIGKVIILRGVSGSGKSTYTRKHHPAALVCSADDFFIGEDGVYRFDGTRIKDAHKWCMRKFVDAVVVEYLEIVVDNTHTTKWELAPYLAVAEAHDYEVEIVWCRCPVEIAAARNAHGVPAKQVAAMERRFEAPLPWWNQKEVWTDR